MSKNKTNEKKKTGLDHLDDDDLVFIVQSELAEHGGLKSFPAKVAFEELARRSGKAK